MQSPWVRSAHEALAHLSRTLARWAPTADRPVDHDRNGRCRGVAAGNGREGQGAGRARARRGRAGLKRQPQVATLIKFGMAATRSKSPNRPRSRPPPPERAEPERRPAGRQRCVRPVSREFRILTNPRTKAPDGQRNPRNDTENLGVILPPAEVFMRLAQADNERPRTSRTRSNPPPAASESRRNRRSDTGTGRRLSAWSRGTSGHTSGR